MASAHVTLNNHSTLILHLYYRSGLAVLKALVHSPGHIHKVTVRAWAGISGLMLSVTLCKVTFPRVVQAIKTITLKKQETVGGWVEAGHFRLRILDFFPCHCCVLLPVHMAHKNSVKRKMIVSRALRTLANERKPCRGRKKSSQRPTYHQGVLGYAEWNRPRCERLRGERTW